jgi:nucleotide-binding universal stress UspA family protein
MSSSEKRFSRIFAVIDPTRFVQTAYLRAEAIAKSNGAELIAYCCVSEGNGDSAQESIADRMEVVRESIQRMATLPEEQLTVYVESANNWRRALVEAAAGSNTDLVVKIASRHSLVGRVFSATADWMLLSEARQPILLVADRVGSAEPRRLLAAIKQKPDDEEHEQLNRQIVELSHYLGDVVGFDVHAATAYKGDDIYFDRQRFADFCRLPRNHVHAVEGAPYVAIAKAASDVGADTIVIGNPEESETAQRLIDHADADMIILPSSG